VVRMPVGRSRAKCAWVSFWVSGGIVAVFLHGVVLC